MNTQPKIIVITGYGINCEEETAKAFAASGGHPEIVHINDLISKNKRLDDYQILAIPGGFSYGDDTGSGNAFANRIKNNLQDDILNFIKGDKLVIGLCNGFQILANLGLVPAIDKKYGERQVALVHNNIARYGCRWIYLKNFSKKCIFTKGIDILHAPVAHGEGNFYCDDQTLETLKKNDQIVLRYVHEDGTPANGQFPTNPNGALEDIAGICDETGKIFGMMPHPERFFTFENEEGWGLKKEKLIREGKAIPRLGAGLKIYENAVNYFK